MKEAQGELNMTIIVVTILAMLSLFFFTVIWPSIHGNFRQNTSCSKAICPCPRRDADGFCVIPDDGLVECYLKGHEEEKIICTWKG